MTEVGLHAFRRFGLGRRGLEAVPSDPVGWLTNQLTAADPALEKPGPSTDQALSVYRREDSFNHAKGPRPEISIGELFRKDTTDLLRLAGTSDLPFRERLVWFWSNHFTVSGRGNPATLALAGAYVQEAIRPHVTGRFADMLKAVMRHPAMIFYLDNQASVGPDSQLGRREHRGVNENLARECLELHTLGLGSGFTQQDVTSFAAIISGRSAEIFGEHPGFVFRPEAHEPGSKLLLGHRFAEGFAGSEEALAWIANHPATIQHIAGQLVRHFIADDPPPACIMRVARVLRDTDGNLGEAMRTIIAMPEAWEPLRKFRSPAEYVVAVQRALDLPFEPGDGLSWASGDIGQSFMAAMLPNGWPDTARDWLSGEALLKRTDWAVTQASRPGAPDAETVAAAIFGDTECSTATQFAYRGAPTKAEALATLMASPEFLRR